VTFIDGTQVAPADLAARLGEIAAAETADKPRQIMLRGDTAISYGQMMRVMGELNRAGLNSVSLVTTGSSNEN
jgi:biopolymer transport protein TolR